MALARAVARGLDDLGLASGCPRRVGRRRRRRGIFDRPIVDVAVIERGGGPSPDLLTLDTAAADSGARVTLLRRDVAWSIFGEATLDLNSPIDSIPWLVDLGDGRFAVVQVMGQPRSVVVPLRVDPSSPANIEELGESPVRRRG